MTNDRLEPANLRGCLRRTTLVKPEQQEETVEFGCFFVGPRPLLHEQYADGQQINPNPVRRTDAEVYHDILKGARLAEDLGFDSVWIAEHAFSEHSIISSPHSLLAAIAAQTKRIKLGSHAALCPGITPCVWHKRIGISNAIFQRRFR